MPKNCYTKAPGGIITEEYSLMKRSPFFLLILSLIFSSHAFAQKAFIIVPVANAVGSPLNGESAINDYNCMCASWGPSADDKIVCPRIHQFLFNEQVTIMNEMDDQVLIESSSVYFDTDDDIRECQYWTLKKYVLPFSELKKRDLSSRYIPKPFGKPTFSTDSDLVTITLKLPFYDEFTNRTYSAGTRFVAQPEKSRFIAWIYDPSHHVFQTVHIPHSVIAPVTYETNEDKIEEFVSLLSDWAHRSEGKVPFVWGGASLIHFYPHFQFSLKEKIASNGKRVRYWSIHHQFFPLAGFDASGLILRATQICQIPYFFKNSKTALKHLQKRDATESLHNGDLLYVPGGLFVISDVRRNKMIAASGYQFGYGALAEFKLEDFFMDISTYKELQNVIANNGTLITKKADGSIAREIKEYQFLSLGSLY
jgi:hypothetical protein